MARSPWLWALLQVPREHAALWPSSSFPSGNSFTVGSRDLLVQGFPVPCTQLPEKAMATHSSTLAWKIPWRAEPGRVQSMGLWTVGHDWATSHSCIGEGNGNPLQCSCLENPRDGEAWWAAIYKVTQSQTRLKWLSSSSTPLHCPERRHLRKKKQTKTTHSTLRPPALEQQVHGISTWGLSVPFPFSLTERYSVLSHWGSSPQFLYISWEHTLQFSHWNKNIMC